MNYHQQGLPIGSLLRNRYCCGIWWSQMILARLGVDVIEGSNTRTRVKS